MLKIFSLLTYQDLCKMSMVCQQYNKISSDNLLWKKFYIAGMAGRGRKHPPKRFPKDIKMWYLKCLLNKQLGKHILTTTEKLLLWNPTEKSKKSGKYNKIVKKNTMYYKIKSIKDDLF